MSRRRLPLRPPAGAGRRDADVVDKENTRMFYGGAKKSLDELLQRMN